MTSLYPRVPFTPNTRATAEQVNSETEKIKSAIDTLSEQVAAIDTGEGISHFIWVAWADSDDGHANFSAVEPDTRSFIGMAYNKLTSIKSENPDDYQWARFRGVDGEPGGITAFLTNEMHSLPADAAGNVTSYAGATGSFKVFLGLNDVSASFSLSTQVNPQGLTVDYADQAYAVTGGLDAGEAQAPLTIRATGTGGFSGVVVDKQFSLGKSKSGSDGAAAKTLTLLSDRQTIAYNAAGAPSPSTQTIAFSTNRQNTAATINWTVTDASGAARTPVTDYLSAATGNGVTMTEAQFAAARDGTSGVIVTASLTDGATISDKISVVRVQAGANGSNGEDGYSVSPSSAALNVIASFAGVPDVAAFPKTVTFSVLKGDTDLSTNGSVSYSLTMTNCSASLGGTNNRVLTVNNMSADTATAIVTILVSGVAIALVYVILTKSKAGLPAMAVQTTTISAPPSAAYTGTQSAGIIGLLGVSAGDVIRVEADLHYGASSGTTQVWAKAQYRYFLGGSSYSAWSDIDVEDIGSGGTNAVKGVLRLSKVFTAPSGSLAYQFQLLARHNGTPVNVIDGTFAASLTV